MTIQSQEYKQCHVLKLRSSLHKLKIAESCSRVKSLAFSRRQRVYKEEQIQDPCWVLNFRWTFCCLKILDQTTRPNRCLSDVKVKAKFQHNLPKKRIALEQQNLWADLLFVLFTRLSECMRFQHNSFKMENQSNRLIV